MKHRSPNLSISSLFDSFFRKIAAEVHQKRWFPSQAPDPPAPGNSAPGNSTEWFYCRADGCGRRFGSDEKLAAHVQRRHQQEEVLET